MGERNGVPAGNRRRIDAAVKGAFLASLRNGARLEDAARAAGCSLAGLYGARKRDPLLQAAWSDALERSAAPRLVAANNKRGWQLRRMRHVRFTDERKRIFLDRFAGTCDATEAAEAAGVDESTVYKHLKSDAAFARGWQEALEVGRARLEAEAMRQRLEAQAKLRAALCPTGEVAAEFERVMKLLPRYDRRDGSAGRRFVPRAHLKPWTFEEAMQALDRKLAALNLPLVRIGEGDDIEADPPGLEGEDPAA